MQRGHFAAKPREPRQQVVAKCTRGDHFIEISMCGCNDAQLHCDWPHATDGGNFMFLQHT